MVLVRPTLQRQLAACLPAAHLPACTGCTTCVQFAMTLTGSLTVPYAGAWTFFVGEADDGTRVYIDGQIVLTCALPSRRLQGSCRARPRHC